MNYSVPLSRLVEEFNLSVAYRATDFEQIQVMVDEVSRPGLPLKDRKTRFPKAQGFDWPARSQELYGKKYALYKAKQTLARVLACPIPGLALSLTVGALLCTAEMQTQGIVVMGIGSVVVLFLTYAFYDDVGDNINKRRSAIARQFPNVVSKMALLAHFSKLDRYTEFAEGLKTL